MRAVSLSLLRERHLSLTAVVVRDYDEAIAFYVGILGFKLVQDTPVESPVVPESGKRWVIVAPTGSSESRILLAQAMGDEQISRIGDQTGGRVFLFLYTDDFWRDYNAYRAKGVEFIRGEPREESYGTVAVFLDVCGNMWDLIQPSE